MNKKKLQVFVSSTYSDLIIERQSAVLAILNSGHIPAGMELFAANDQTQVNVIKKWIDESDVFLLILGGRYGTIDNETGKSYIQIEYEYALSKNKPFFAIVISEEHLEAKVKLHGSSVIEKDHSDKYKSFKNTVLTKVVRFWSDIKDIQLAIYEAMSEFNNRSELIGWIPGDQSINAAALAEEIARLTKENFVMREQLKMNSANVVVYNGLEFDELYSMLQEVIPNNIILTKDIQRIEETSKSFNSSRIEMIHLLWYYRDELLRGNLKVLTEDILLKLINLRLVQRVFSRVQSYYKLTEAGSSFILKLIATTDKELRAFVYR